MGKRAGDGFFPLILKRDAPPESKMESRTIGRLAGIRRYPVKSMAGEDVNAVYVHETGLNGDRVFAFYDHNSRRDELPYFTGREKKGLLLAKPEIINEPDRTQPYPEGYKPIVDVVLPNGKGIYEVSDPAIIAYITELCVPREVSVTVDYRRAGIQDSKPISIMGLQTVDQLARESGVSGLDPRRFRENFYVSWDNNQPFFEDSLVGRCLQVGDELVIHVVKKNERCPMICVDPDTAEYDKRVLGTVAREHGMNAGVYAMVRTPGAVRRNDSIVLL